MRKQLEKIGKERHQFTGTFDRLGLKMSQGNGRGNHRYTPTICLKNIIDEQGKLVADHLWFNYSSSFLKVGELHPQDRIEFTAIPVEYHKDYHHEKRDMKLGKVSSVHLITHYHPYKPMPLSKTAAVGYVMSINGDEGHGHYSTAYHKWAFAQVNG